MEVMKSRDSAVGTATGHGLDSRAVTFRLPVEARFFSSARRPNRLWGPPSLLSIGSGGPFTVGKAAGA
jgi:hypothetical protein